MRKPKPLGTFKGQYAWYWKQLDGMWTFWLTDNSSGYDYFAKMHGPYKTLNALKKAFFEYTRR